MTWANNDYSYRKKITIDKTKVTGNLTDYTLLISITDADLKDTGNGGSVESSSGYDIIFYDSDDSTKLDHEIVTYTNTSGLIEAWVRIPSLTNANDYILYIYYGKSGVVADQSLTTTWSSDYKLVSHLKDLTTSTCKNSSQTAYTLAKKAANEPVEDTGIIGKAQNFDGSDDYVVANNALVGTGNKTVEMWAYPDADGSYNLFFANAFGGGSDDDGIQLLYGSSGTGVSLALGNGAASGHFMVVAGNISKDAWHKIVATYDGTTLTLVVDTTTTTSTTKSGSEVAGSYNFEIGNATNSGTAFDGKICEVRVSNAVKSATWISTAYNNENSPSTFMSFGLQEIPQKLLSSSLAISDSILASIGLCRTLSDTLTISDSILTASEMQRTISDSFSISDSILSSIGTLRTLSDTLTISDSISFAVNHMEFFDSTGTTLVTIHRPYWDELNGSLSINSMSFSFRSGNYTSYVEDINDESITFTGYDNGVDVLTRFNIIADLADNGTEITIGSLGTAWDATYIISGFTYKPIGLDVFEYTLNLKFVR